MTAWPEPGVRLDPGWGCVNGTGAASGCASPGKAATTSSRVMPQRAARQTGGGVGTVVGAGARVVTAGETLGGCGVAAGAGSFLPHERAATDTSTLASTGLIRRSVMTSSAGRGAAR